MKQQFYKVLLGTESSACRGLHYKINDVTVAPHWNPNGETPVEMGGFSIATRDALIRWIFRGNILYDVIIPEDAEIVYPQHAFADGEIARVNKIIITNPRPVTDKIALNLYKYSHFPQVEYYRVLAGCAICGYKETCEAIMKDHIHSNNAADCLNTFKYWAKPSDVSYPSDGLLYNEVVHKLEELCHS